MAINKKISNDAAELRRKAEEKAAQALAEEETCLSELDAKRILHELRVHQIELEMQNEELRLKQNELEAARKRYFDLYDLAPAGYVTFCDRGFIRETNRTLTSMLGEERNAFSKSPLSVIIFHEDRNIFSMHLNKVIEASESQTCEIRMVRADGKCVWVQMATNPAHNDEFLASITDITERKRLESILLETCDSLERKVTDRTAKLTESNTMLQRESTERRKTERALQKREDQYRTMLHTLLDGFWIVDMQGRFIDVNDSYCKIIGYSHDQLLNMSIRDVEALESPTDIKQRMEEITRVGMLRFESRHRCSDGHLVDLEICVSSLPNSDKVCASLRDITSHILAEEELLTAAHYTRSLIEASLDPLVTINTDGKITDVNEALVNATGIAREQLLGTDFAAYFSDPEKAQKGYQLVFSEGSVRDYQLAIRHISNSLTDVLYNASVYRDEEGNVRGVFAAARDVTELNRALKTIKEDHDNLEVRVSERTSELAHANEQIIKMSFELAWAEELERVRIAGELHDQVGQSLLLAKMKLDSLSDNSISSDLLRRIAAETSSLISTSIHDIRSLTFRMRPPILDTAEIETTLQWLCSSISRDYALHVDFVDDGYPKPLRAEARYSFYQAVREILMNVAKHAGVETAQLSLSTDGHVLMAIVTDNGVGFHKPDALLKHVTGGSYGLYNVQQRMEWIGGRCVIDSTPGQGTSVTLTVPSTVS